MTGTAGPHRRRTAHRGATMLAAALVLVLLPACGAGTGGRTGAGTGEGGSGELTVAAAASLSDAFAEMAAAFEDRNRGVAVRLDVGASTRLVAAVADGAPVDVLAVADPETMAVAEREGLLAGTAEPFAGNRMQLVTPPDDPGGVDGLTDLADAGRVIALCAEEVPCGRLARRILDRAGIVPALDSEEPDVRSLLTKVRTGDVDAALVYRSDVRAAGDAVRVIDLPQAVDLRTVSTIAVTRQASRPDLAADFVAFVVSPAGRAILERAGFGAP